MLWLVRPVFALMDEPPFEPEDEDAVELKQADGSVALENVSFLIQPEVPLIEDLNLDVKPGQRIALMGPTGCGKTTIINLLMRFYDVQKGAIRVSGTDIRHMTRESLRESYGMVLRKPGKKSEQSGKTLPMEDRMPRRRRLSRRQRMPMLTALSEECLRAMILFCQRMGGIFPRDRDSFCVLPA